MVFHLTLYGLFLWAPTPCQAIEWNPELPLAQIPVEPWRVQELQTFNDSGERPTKCVAAFLHYWNARFLREILQDDSIWLVPSPSGSQPAEGQAHGGPYGNLVEAVRHWAFWQEVPCPDDFGRSIPGVLFRANGGNFMQLWKRLNLIHEGEAVEINETGEWIFQPGMPPLEKQWFHAQFAETKKAAEVLRDIGALGARSYQTHQRWATSWGPLGGSADGMPDRPEVMEKLYELGVLTHAIFPPPAWEGKGYVARRARVLTLNQVLMLDPEHTTMQEAYVWFCQQKKMCKKRVHPPKAGKACGSRNVYELVG